MSHGSRNAIRAGLVLVLAVVTLLALVGAFRPRTVAGGPDGQFGYTPDPEGVARFLAELPQPMFRDAGAETIAEAKGVDTFLYRAANKAHAARYGRPWVVERQGIGDCTSWGWAHGIWIAQSIDWETGRLGEPPAFPSTEAIYGGSRVEARNKNGDGSSPVGGWSDGSYGAACARWVRDWGVVYRDQVGGHDLRAYSADRAKQWGAYGNGGQGDKGKLDQIAKRHPANHVALVTTWAEAAAAIEAGFPIPVASNVGFQSVTDEHGYAQAGPTWHHQMLFCAVRYQKNGSPSDALLCLNSWGPRWLTYRGKFPADQPDGSFWVDRRTVERMLGQRDSFAVGSVAGFGWRDLHNGDWLAPPPPELNRGANTLDTLARFLQVTR
jgi:hypothetical protein